MCVVNINISYLCLLRWPKSNDTPVVISTRSILTLVPKYHSYESNFGEMADPRIETEKIQHEPGISHGARQGKDMFIK